MTLDWKHFVLSHLIWIVLISASIVGFESWKAEHDHRLIAEQQIHISEERVTSLEQQILDRDRQTVATTAPIIKIIHDTTTVPQVVAALPEVAPLPVPVIKQPDNSVNIPEPDVLPLFQQVADDKVCRIQFSDLQKDFADQKSITEQKDNQIAALKKKPAFWSRVGSTMKKVGIGIGIGLAVSRYI